MDKVKTGIARRFGRTLAFHVGLVAAAVVLGIFAAEWIIEELLIKEALTTEAEYYWGHFKTDPNFPLPDTRNLTGYQYTPHNQITLPLELRNLETGFHETRLDSGYSVALVSEIGSERVLLVFDVGQVRKLAFFFGLFPLGLLLFVIYGLLFAGYRLFRSSVSPVVVLAKKVEGLKLDTLDSTDFEIRDLPENTDQEIISLTSALNRLIQRIENFVTREQEFTRSVSHELRTPLTVINIACDMLIEEQELSHPARNSVIRIKRASMNMASLVETFLLISREPEQSLTIEPVCVNDVILAEIDQIKSITDMKPIAIKLELTEPLFVKTNQKVLSGLLGNLFRNAAIYTDAGHILVKTSERIVVIEDTGIGMKSEEAKEAFTPYFQGDHKRVGGHGIGLTIVKKLADRFGWSVVIDSTPGEGTQVTVQFPREALEDSRRQDDSDLIRDNNVTMAG